MEISGINVGKRKIDLKKDCFEPKMTEVFVKADQQVKLNLKLKPSCGTLSVTSDPTGAEIYLNEKQMGVTPAELAGLPAGKYAIRLKKDGYEEWTDAIVVKAGTTILVKPANLKAVVLSHSTQSEPIQKPVEEIPKPDKSAAQSKLQPAETVIKPSSQRFVIESSGIIKDTQTGYEWIVGPDKDTTWDQADAWAKGLKTGDKNWRLPYKSEVATLYQKGAGTRNLYPVFQISGWYVWAESENSSNSWSFYLYDGEPVKYLKQTDNQRRAFAIQTGDEAIQNISTDKPSLGTETPKYTKLGQNGEELPFSAISWIMVRDNDTGLIWEVKQNKDGVKDYGNPNDADNEYNWNDANQKFIDALNSRRFDGYTDWRLPTRDELKTLVITTTTYPAINTGYFPNTQSWYWLSTPYVIGTYGAWGVSFGYGYGSSNYKNGYSYVRAVRGGK